MRFMQLLDRTLLKKSQNVAKGEKVRQNLFELLLNSSFFNLTNFLSISKVKKILISYLVSRQVQMSEVRNPFSRKEWNIGQTISTEIQVSQNFQWNDRKTCHFNISQIQMCQPRHISQKIVVVCSDKIS